MKHNMNSDPGLVQRPKRGARTGLKTVAGAAALFAAGSFVAACGSAKGSTGRETTRPVAAASPNPGSPSPEASTPTHVPLSRQCEVDSKALNQAYNLGRYGFNAARVCSSSKAAFKANGDVVRWNMPGGSDLTAGVWAQRATGSFDTVVQAGAGQRFSLDDKYPAAFMPNADEVVAKVGHDTVAQLEFKRGAGTLIPDDKSHLEAAAEMLTNLAGVEWDPTSAAAG
jgi:hypothetical protein